MSFHLSHLPPSAQAHVSLWTARMEQLARHDRGWTNVAKAVAPEWGVTYATAVRYFCAYRKHGIAALLDQRKFSRYLGSGRTKGLPAQFVDYWQGMNERFQRRNGSGATCYKLLMDQLKQWRRGVATAAIPGYDTPPRNQPGKDHPVGWSYNHLSRLKSEQVAQDMARMGRGAAKRLLPKIYSTRVGIVPGQLLEIDDQWHDIQIAWNAGGVGRPLSFDLLDVASCYEIMHGVQPRLEREDGKKMGLREDDAFWLLLSYLASQGYRDDVGTTIIVERGTATVRAAFEEGLKLASDGKILIDRGSIDRRAVRGLMFDGPARGNPRHKALREGAFGYFRNLSALLPGATGRNRDESPEEAEALVKYAEKLLRDVSPERRHLLRLPLLTEGQYMDLLWSLKQIMNNRTEHAMEGWEACGYVASEFILPGTDQPLPLEHLQARLLSMQAEDPAKAELLTMALTDPKAGLIRTRRQSPREVWEAHASKLTRLPVWTWNMIVPVNMAHKRTINDSRELVVTGITSDPLRYDARCFTSARREVRLRPGDEVLLFINPFMPREILCCDVHGAAIGVMHQIEKVNRLDVEGFIKRAGEVKQMVADVEADVARRAEPLATERAAMVKHNERVVSGEPVTPAEVSSSRLASRLQRTSHAVFEPTEDTEPTEAGDLDPEEVCSAFDE